MSLNDPIADMLTRIRNAARNKAKHVSIRRNKICVGIAEVLKTEGFINGYDLIEDDKQGLIRLELKYGPRGEKLINEIKRVSKVGRRVYRGVDNLPRVMDGLGISIISTSQGIVSDRQARAQRIGGELLATVE